MSVKRYLITGGTGFLGEILTNQIRSRGFHVTTLGSSKDNDLAYDLTKCFSFAESWNFEVVVHCAGKAHTVPRTSLEKQLFFDINVKGTENLLVALENLKEKPQSFIFISSVSVYGQNSGENINEEHSLDAEDAYGLSKITAEEVITRWCLKHKVTCSILRLPLIIGASAPGNLGAMINGIKKGYYFNINGGTARKSMVLAEDVADAVVKVANVGGVYNLTDGVNPSFFELSERISSIAGSGKPRNMPFTIAFILAKIGNILGNRAPLTSNKLMKICSDLTFDDSRARANFNWNPSPILQKLDRKMLK